MFVNIPVSFSTQASLAWDPQDQPFATVSAHRCNNTILQARFCVCNIAMQVWLCGRMFFGDIQMKTPIALVAYQLFRTWTSASPSFEGYLALFWLLAQASWNQTVKTNPRTQTIYTDYGVCCRLHSHLEIGIRLCLICFQNLPLLGLWQPCHKRQASIFL